MRLVSKFLHKPHLVVLRGNICSVDRVPDEHIVPKVCSSGAPSLYGVCKPRVTSMRTTLLTAAAAALLISSAPLATANPAVTDCVGKIHITIDGTKHSLTAGEDFRVVLSPKGKIGVTFKQRIENDSRWAHAKKEATDCINAATKVADKVVDKGAKK